MSQIKIICSAALTCAATAVSQDPVAWSQNYRGGTVIFSIETGRAGIAANRASTQPRLSATLPGEVFDAPIALRPVTRTQADGRTPQGALEADRSAQLADDADWIAENFAASDRAEVNKWLADADMRRANRGVLERQGQPKVLGWARVRNFLVAILETAGGSRLPATLVREDGRWKRTNALSADPTFDIIFAAVRERGTWTRSGAPAR